jgi:hypothetical protein
MRASWDLVKMVGFQCMFIPFRRRGKWRDMSWRAFGWIFFNAFIGCTFMRSYNHLMFSTSCYHASLRENFDLPCLKNTRQKLFGTRQSIRRVSAHGKESLCCVHRDKSTAKRGFAVCNMTTDGKG